MAVAPSYATGLDISAQWYIPGAYKEIYFTGTVGAADTYATGGFAFSPSSFGLTTFLWVSPVAFSTGHWGIWDKTNAKIKVFSAAATELANASAALQNATFTVQAAGK